MFFSLCLLISRGRNGMYISIHQTKTAHFLQKRFVVSQNRDNFAASEWIRELGVNPELSRSCNSQSKSAREIRATWSLEKAKGKVSETEREVRRPATRRQQ